MQIRHLLIGSRALELVDPTFKARIDSDYDIITNNQEDLNSISNMNIEVHQLNMLNNSRLLNTEHVDLYIRINNILIHVANKPLLSMIKRSHLHRDLKFGQHITTWHKHLSKEDLDVELLQERTKQTLQKFPQQGPNLKKTVEEFFDDAVVKKYSHDWLHELYAFEDKPMYTKMQTNPELAWCDKQLWDNFTHEQKIHTVQEETYVIATERFLVPKEFKYPAKLAYNKALNKVCTTLCSNWFRDFAIDNYPEILEKFDESKVKSVQQTINNL